MALFCGGGFSTAIADVHGDCSWCAFAEVPHNCSPCSNCSFNKAIRWKLGEVSRDNWSNSKDRVVCSETATKQGHEQQQSSGRKDDADKLPWDLLPWEAVSHVVAVLRFGAKKYAPYNWSTGIAYSRVFAAAQRHLTAWWLGESRDPETGIYHLAHAACCILFLLHYERVATIKEGFDDRVLKATRKEIKK